MSTVQHQANHPGLSYLAVHDGLHEVLGRSPRPADLIVVGAHLPGVDDHRRCPVLVVGAPQGRGPVLVALDDDVHAGELVGYAAAEAARMGTALCVVHVWTESAAQAHHRRVQAHDSITEADRLLAELVYAHRSDGRADRQILHDRDPARALVDVSRSASLYRVVAGVDGSQGGHRALAWAVQEAAARGGTVQAVSAWSFDGVEIDPVVAVDRGSALDRAQRLLRTEIGAVTAGYETPPPVAAEAVEGPPAAVLTRAAMDADLLVLGSHGHGRLRHTVLGSVSDECVRHATCPVVVIHVPAAQPVRPPSDTLLSS